LRREPPLALHADFPFKKLMTDGHCSAKGPVEAVVREY
jgi:hypothetical protein